MSIHKYFERMIYIHIVSYYRFIAHHLKIIYMYNIVLNLNVIAMQHFKNFYVCDSNLYKKIYSI